MQCDRHPVSWVQSSVMLLNMSARDWVRFTVLFCSCSTHGVVCWSGGIPAVPLPILQVLRMTHCQISDKVYHAQSRCFRFSDDSGNQLNSGYNLKIPLAIMKFCLACLCVSLTPALSSPCTVSTYQETLEKQICIPLEAMLWCWDVWKI